MHKPAPTIRLNLLRPQSGSEKLPLKFIAWLLSSGRYIFAVVNALVLIAFITRFKFDADIAAKNEAIAEQIPYIESLRPYELIIRNTQLKLSTIATTKKSTINWQLLLKKIADQVPASITLTNINIDNNLGNTSIHISGHTQFNSDINSFAVGLAGDNAFSNVNIVSINLEQGIIKFVIDTQSQLTIQGGENL